MAVTELTVPLDRLSRRVAATDWMRGLVMVLMVIDHASIAFDRAITWITTPRCIRTPARWRWRRRNSFCADSLTFARPRLCFSWVLPSRSV